MALRQPPWSIEYFQRHASDDPDQSVPGDDFLKSCPESVSLKIRAVLQSVAEAPPPSFAGGGFWEAMHDDMRGYYEVRVPGPKRRSDKGPKKRLYRLFCLLERNGASVGLDGPSLIIVDGRDKPVATALPAKEYEAVKELGTEYLSRKPRSVWR